MKKLTTILASLAVAKQNAYNIHWNIEDIKFLGSHNFTEEIFENLTSLFDEVAEKIRMNGKTAMGTYTEYIEESIISETPTKIYTAKEAFSIIEDNLSSIRDFVNNYGEAKTSIQVTLDNIALFTDKYAWIAKVSNK